MPRFLLRPARLGLGAALAVATLALAPAGAAELAAEDFDELAGALQPTRSVAVADLDATAENRDGGRWRARVEVAVATDTGFPVAGAEVDLAVAPREAPPREAPPREAPPSGAPASRPRTAAAPSPSGSATGRGR